jgi:alkaline phosphatase D
VSPVPVVHLTNFVTNFLDLPALGLADDLRDEWEHKSNYAERNTLLDGLFDYSASHNKPVIILSGDVHIGAAFKLTRKGKTGARVYQLTSSGITFAKSPGKLLRLVVRDRGELDGLPKSKRTFLERLHVFVDNNFAFVHSWLRDDGTLELAWDLFGSTGAAGEVVRLKRLHLH